MAIFKSKHKKDQNSASNRADAGASQPASPQRAGAGAGGGPGTLDSSHNTLKGSLGRANGHAQQQQNGPYANGSMASSAPGDGGSRLFASAGSANSASNAPYGLANGSGPGAFPPHESGGYPGPIAPSSSSFPTGPNGIPSGMIAPLHQQPQPQQPQLGSSHPRATTLSSSSGSSHTVLYPWSQRRVALLPSQHLAPLAPSDSPSLASSPVLGPTSPLPFPRYGHSVNPIATATPTGDLYIFGGLVQNSVRNDLYVVHANSASNPTAPQQQQHQLQQPGGTVGIALVETRGEVPGPRVGHASVGVGNVLIVWGGDTKTRPEERQDDGLYLLNLSTRDWTRVKTVGRSPEGRYGHAVAMVGSRFFVFGGQTDDGGFKNDLCYFDLQKRECPPASLSRPVPSGLTEDGRVRQSSKASPRGRSSTRSRVSWCRLRGRAIPASPTAIPSTCEPLRLRGCFSALPSGVDRLLTDCALVLARAALAGRTASTTITIRGSTTCRRASGPNSHASGISPFRARDTRRLSSTMSCTSLAGVASTERIWMILPLSRSRVRPFPNESSRGGFFETDLRCPASCGRLPLVHVPEHGPGTERSERACDGDTRDQGARPRW